MQNVKSNISANISELRIMSGMTQLELAEKLNYSDKAVSKWERGESVPDVTVLCEIAKIFQVSLDYLVESEEEHKKRAIQVSGEEKNKTYREKLIGKPDYSPMLNKYLIMGISIFALWLVATVIYLILFSINPESKAVWLCFVYAVPASVIIWLVFNCIWFNTRLNFLIVSILVWSILAVCYFTLLAFSINAPLIFVLGAPAQVIIFMWSRISFNPNK